MGLILKILSDSNSSPQNYSKSTKAEFPDLQKQTFKKWLELQISKKRNRIEKTQCAEKKRSILFFFSRDDGRSWREFFSALEGARADFLFRREKRIFCVFSSLLSLFGDRVESFFVSIKQQKRDFTPEI